MPKSWYIYDECKTEFEKEICAYKKPYFMNYIYAKQMVNYKSHIKNNTICGAFDYGKGECVVKDLLRKPKLTSQQQSFVDDYIQKFPVFDEQSTMNRLCHMIENEFDGYATRVKQQNKFDASILKRNKEYSRKDYNAIKRIYLRFNHDLQRLRAAYANSNADIVDYNIKVDLLSESFMKDCMLACSNKESLYDIIIDMCYTNNNAKSFAWKICGDEIIDRLFEQNENQLNYLVRNEMGNITYKGLRFSKQVMIIGEED